DVAGVAEEPEAVAVGGQVDVLGAGSAVEAHGVTAGLAFDGVAAVARVPDEGVVARAQQCQVVASIAVDRVAAVATEQLLGTRASGEIVIPGATVGRQGDRLRRESGRRDRVVAAESVDGE